MNKQLENKIEVFAKLGSFWVRNTDKTDPYGQSLARSISRLIDNDGARGRFNEVLNLMLNKKSVRYNFELTFTPLDIVPIDSSSGEIKYANNTFLDSSTDTPIPEFAWSDTLSAHYLLPIDERFNPISIRAVHNEILTTGLSFTTGPGFIRFFGSPSDLFPSGIINVIAAEVDHDHIHDYTLKVDSVENKLDYLVEYYRAHHSAHMLELALNQIAGRVIVEADAVIVDRIDHVNGAVTYVTDDDKIYYVNYQHPTQEVGDTLYKHHIFDRAVTVAAKPNTNADNWWQPYFAQEGKGNTLKMQDLHPAYPAVEWVNSSTTVTGETHALDAGEIGVDITDYVGSGGDWSLFEDIRDQAEEMSDTYMNDIFGLADAGTTSVNMIDWLFTYLIGDRAVIVDIDTDKMSDLTANKVAHVARREMPLTAIPIIRQYAGTADNTTPNPLPTAYTGVNFDDSSYDGDYYDSGEVTTSGSYTIYTNGTRYLTINSSDDGDALYASLAHAKAKTPIAYHADSMVSGGLTWGASNTIAFSAQRVLGGLVLSPDATPAFTVSDSGDDYLTASFAGDYYISDEVDANTGNAIYSNGNHCAAWLYDGIYDDTPHALYSTYWMAHSSQTPTYFSGNGGDLNGTALGWENPAGPTTVYDGTQLLVGTVTRP